MEAQRAIQVQNDNLLSQANSNEQQRLLLDSNSRAAQAQLQHLLPQAHSNEQHMLLLDSNSRFDQAQLRQLKDELAQAHETIADAHPPLATPHRSNLDTPSAYTQVGRRYGGGEHLPEPAHYGPPAKDSNLPNPSASLPQEPQPETQLYPITASTLP